VTKALDGTDVLAILPAGIGKMAISATFILVLNRMEENISGSSEYVQHGVRLPADSIAVRAYPHKLFRGRTSMHVDIYIRAI
jgi:hypothetical protein